MAKRRTSTKKKIKDQFDVDDLWDGRPRRRPYSPGDGAASVLQSLWKALKAFREEFKFGARFKAWLKEPVIKNKKL